MWAHMGDLLSLGCKVMPVRGDGFCFLKAIYVALYFDYNDVITVDHMENNIL